MTDPTAAVEVWARMLCAADVHVHGADHPTWQQLVGEPGSRIRDDYRKAAAWLVPRLTVPARQAPATDHRLSVQHADALWDAVAIPGPTEPTFTEQHQRVCKAVADILDEMTPAAVLPASVDRADVLRDFLWRLEQSAGDAAAEKFLDDNPELRRMAAETPGEAKPWLSDSARIGRALIWSWTDIGKGAFGEGYRAAQAEARALLGGQRGTDVTPPAVGTPQPKQGA